MVDARVANVVARHERSLMRVARHWSLCRDDALDAYQRALEIYVRRIDAVDPVTEISWLRVVVKHEALAVRRMRAESVTVEDVDLDGHAPEAQRPVDELLAARERVSRGAEALRRLKPDEAKALMLKAEGHSYKEISEQLGWTYTKTNRSITEGRARFLKVFAEIETGAECERVAPTLAALVGGTATADALLELRPHLQHCTTCRATVRSLHESRLGRLAALLPIPAVLAPLHWVQGRVGASAEPTTVVPQLERAAEDEDRIVLSPVEGIPDLSEAVRRIDLPDPSEIVRHERLFDIKAHLFQWWQRLQGSDVATTAQLAATNSGGGRIATIGAIIGLCLSGVGAGTVCVVSGVIDNPLAPQAKSQGKRSTHRSAQRPSRRSKHTPSAPTSAIATPVPTPTSAPGTVPKNRMRADRQRKRVPKRSPTREHEQAPASTAPPGTRAGGASEFDPTYQPSNPPPPATPPSSAGGTEFF